jgi:hypothetical protein
MKKTLRALTLRFSKNDVCRRGGVGSAQKPRKHLWQPFAHHAFDMSVRGIAWR